MKPARKEVVVKGGKERGKAEGTKDVSDTS